MLAWLLPVVDEVIRQQIEVAHGSFRRFLSEQVWFVPLGHDQAVKDWLMERLEPRRSYDDVPSIEELNDLTPEPAPLNFQPPPLVAEPVVTPLLIEAVTQAVLAKLQSAGYGTPRQAVSVPGEVRSLGDVIGPVGRAVRRFGG